MCVTDGTWTLPFTIYSAILLLYEIHDRSLLLGFITFIFVYLCTKAVFCFLKF